VRENGPEHVRQIELISMAELHEIRRLWVIDKHELEDSLPGIYAQVTGEEFPGRRLDDNQVFGAEEIEILRELCEGDLLHFELTRELLDVEGRYRTMARRAGLYDALERTLRRGFYDDESDATERAHRHRAIKSAVEAERSGYSDEPEILSSMLADAAGSER
jgi:DNA sulfur modification protein DndC